jgi:hypothetical protein
VITFDTGDAGAAGCASSASTAPAWRPPAAKAARRAGWRRFAAASVAAAIALTFAVLQTQPEAAPQIVEQTIAAPEVPLLPAAETPWETAYQTEALLAVEDTTQFTDSEIGFLLY